MESENCRKKDDDGLNENESEVVEMASLNPHSHHLRYERKVGSDTFFNKPIQLSYTHIKL